MVETITVVAVIVLLTLAVGATTQWIVHKLNPPKVNQPRPEGIAKSVGKVAPIAFIVVTVLNILLILSNSPLAFLLIASGPAMIVLGIMSLLRLMTSAIKS